MISPAYQLIKEVLAWIAIWLGMGEFYGKYKTDKENKEIGKKINMALSADWVSTIAEFWMNIFDSIYIRSRWNKEILWFGILFTYWNFFTLRVTSLIFVPTFPGVEKVLAMAIGISVSGVLLIFGVFSNDDVFSYLHNLSDQIPKCPFNISEFYWRGFVGSVLLLGLTLSLAYTTGIFLYSGMNVIFVAISLIISVPVLLFEFIGLSNQQNNNQLIHISHEYKYRKRRKSSFLLRILKNYKIAPIICLLLSILIFDLIIVYSALVYNTVSMGFIATIGFSALLVPFGGYVIFEIISEDGLKIDMLSKKINPNFEIDPFRTMVLSLIPILFLSYIRPEATQEFISLLIDGQLLLLSYLIFNIYADSVSVHETHWILNKAIDADSISVTKLAGYFSVDVLLSAIIYFILPMLVGVNDQFFMGIIFSGDRPWIGILFWSTFATSIIFYSFIVSAFILKIIGKIGEYMHSMFAADQIEKHPYPLLGVTFGIVMRIIVFILGS